VSADPRPYRFATVWTVGGPPGAAFAVLEAVPAYPDWWPDIRAVPSYDDDRADVLVRARLPYTLRLHLVRERTDPEAGVLQVALHGDLEGGARWTVEGNETSTRCRFEEWAVLTVPRLRRWETIAAPLYRANHTAMMRRGERGFRAAVAGYRVAGGGRR
jgi:hypothetical protein